ncbi:hypothetical protein KW782_04175 [Candidatus Parcubacteria bacterium]|nr:hypothetical protein [Candidatus Parcubacteria bacterium]
MNKRYWLRWGLILGGVGGLLGVASIFLEGLPIVILVLIFGIELDEFPLSLFPEWLSFIILGFVPLFILGAVLGLVYGKIKNRNQPPQLY